MMDRRTFLQTSAAAALTASSSGCRNAENKCFPFDLDSLIHSKALSDTFRRHLLFQSGLTYLNTGSLGPCPDFIVEAVHSSMVRMEADPVSKFWGPMGEEMEEVRQKVANFIGSEKEEILLTCNTTEGMNLIGSGFRLRSGDEVLTTNHEHPGGLVCWEHMAKFHGIQIKIIDIPVPVESKSQLMDLISSQISARTRVCSFSHVCTITGLRMPFKDISDLLRSREILLVCDGAQAPGMLEVDVQQMGVDVYATSGHKWLLGPKGTGFCFIRKKWQDLIQPVFTHTGYQAYTASSGTRNLPAILGLGMALDLHTGLGKKRIENECLLLRSYLFDRLLELQGINILSPKNPDLGSAMITIQLTNKSNKEIFEALKAQSIIVKLAPKYNALRISTHFYNTHDEVDRFIEAFKKLI